jgi:hypothetical protein
MTIIKKYPPQKPIWSDILPFVWEKPIEIAVLKGTI